MIKKCVGCGAVFQTKDEKKEGYVTPDAFDKADVCRRCFRLKNYGDYELVNKDFYDYKIIFDNLKKKNSLILFLCDVLSLDESLEELNDFNGKVILVITKKDLLPKSVKESKLSKYIDENYDLKIIQKIFVSSVKNYNLDCLMGLIKKHKINNEVYLVGNTNAGKSTLINQIIKSYSKEESYITTSVLPATTLDIIKVKLNDELTLVDTPGLVCNDSYLTKALPKDVKILSPKVEIKPRTYQIRPNQSLIIGDNYARIDYFGSEKNSFTLYISNEVKVSRINVDTNNIMHNLYMHSFNVSKGTDIVIKGLCFCKIVKEAKVKVYVKDGALVYERPNLI